MDSCKDSIGVLVACMPKSGSTFLSSLIASIPGFRREHVVPGYKRREQEICIKKLEEAFLKTEFLRSCWRNNELVNSERPRGFVTQMHLRYTEPTGEIIERYNLHTVVLVRNIFDIIVSLGDHLRDSSPNMAMAYVSEDMRGMPEKEMHNFIVDMVVPWYLNFYRCWQDCEKKIVVTYEKLIENPFDTLVEIMNASNVGISLKKIRVSMERVESANVRLNKGVAGRGQSLDGYVVDRVHHLCGYYPDTDFSLIGVTRDASRGESPDSSQPARERDGERSSAGDGGQAQPLARRREHT